MAEFTEEFAQCWNAAGSHIQRMAGGDLMSWLKATLAPPFLEHLSFRLGNQLFFIQIEDEDGMLEVPGSPDGLLAIANGCKGHPCLMPMKKLGGKWQPSASGWGLIDAETRRSINPISFVTDEKIEMTEWELQDLAVQVVRQQIEKEGHQLMSWNGDPRVNPSVWFVGSSGGPEWVLVRAVRHPEKEATEPENKSELKSHFGKMGFPGHFASVAVASADDPFDPGAKSNGNYVPLFRGVGMRIRYEGLRSF